VRAIIISLAYRVFLAQDRSVFIQKQEHINAVTCCIYLQCKTTHKQNFLDVVAAAQVSIRWRSFLRRYSTVDTQKIEFSQNSWGRAVVEVGAAPTWAEAHARAVDLVKNHYLIEDGSLLFCPTKAADKQFRASLQDAVSYFVGSDPTHAEDAGFALEPWTSVRFENAGVVCRGEVGIAMGNYFFGKENGSELKVEYSFVYVEDAAGNLKIQLHHSALPYGH